MGAMISLLLKCEGKRLLGCAVSMWPFDFKYESRKLVLPPPSRLIGPLISTGPFFLWST